MKKRPTRKKGGLRYLSEPERRKVRRKVVAMVLKGSTQAAAARKFGVSELSMGRWIKQYEKGGFGALDVKQRKKPDDVEVEHFLLCFDVLEKPAKMSQTEGKRLAEEFIGKTVACDWRDHEVVSAYFDSALGIVLSYVHVPIVKDVLK